MATYLIDKGHTTQNGGCCGAIGIVKESEVNRKIGDLVIKYLKEMGHTVIDVSCNSSNNRDAQLQAITRKANAYNADLFVSIHLNAGGGHGTETYVLSGASTNTRNIAKRINNKVVKACNFRDRGVKEANFYVLRNTKASAILVEAFFCDSKEDCNKYNVDKIAIAIVEGITGEEYKPPVQEPLKDTFYRVIAGSYKNKVTAENVKKDLESKGIKGVFLEAYNKN